MFLKNVPYDLDWMSEGHIWKKKSGGNRDPIGHQIHSHVE